MTRLLDGNVLVALAVAEHVHHEPARRWFLQLDERFATTPITQGTLLRFLVREGLASGDALAVLGGMVGHERHEFWPDDRGYGADALRGVIGHRQVTDGYLASLARAREERLATFDRGIHAVHSDVAELIPV